MRKTSNYMSENRGQLAVGIDELKEMLSCGRTTAEQIGKDAEAIIKVGRRKLYHTAKIQKYLEKVSGNTEKE